MSSEDIPLDLPLNLPNDSKIIKIAISNISNALNKASKAGAFDLKESGQLCRDLDVIGELVKQILQHAYKEIIPAPQ